MSGSNNKLSPYLRAYHGSPYDFQKFENSAIGTGEGGKAYGAGHYVAEARETGEHYMRSVTRERTNDSLSRLVWRGHPDFPDGSSHLDVAKLLDPKTGDDVDLDDHVKASVARFLSGEYYFPDVSTSRDVDKVKSAAIDSANRALDIEARYRQKNPNIPKDGLGPVLEWVGKSKLTGQDVKYFNLLNDILSNDRTTGFFSKHGHAIKDAELFPGWQFGTSKELKAGIHRYFAGLSKMAGRVAARRASQKDFFKSLEKDYQDARDASADVYNLSKWYAKNQTNIEAAKFPAYNRIREIVDYIFKNSNFETTNNAPPGRLYELALKVDPNKMLDWDNSIGSHHVDLQQAVRTIPELARALEHTYDKSGKIEHYAYLSPRYSTGADIYKYLANQRGGPVLATKALHEAGIHGIKYLDLLSRGSKPHAQIYFDGKPVNKNSPPVTTPGAGTAEEKIQNDLALLQRTVEEHRVNAGNIDELFDDLLNRTANLLGAVKLHKSIRSAYESAKSLGDRISVKPNSNVTYNYVIFDPDMIQIVRKYDLGGNLVEDYGFHVREVDGNPFEGEDK
jgi:hypothetical protein